MRVKEVMLTEVAVLQRGASLLDASRLLINTQAGAIPVVDAEGGLVGIVSEFDLIRHVMALSSDKGGAEGAALSDLVKGPLAAPVDTLMTSEVVSVVEDAELEAAAQLMLQHRTKRLPVVRARAVVGMVARLDLMKALIAGSRDAKAPPGEGISDDQLRQNVMIALRQLGVPLGSGFDVVANRGVVHLWGEVLDEALYGTCQAAVAKVAGVLDVFNHMNIRRAGRSRSARA